MRYSEELLVRIEAALRMAEAELAFLQARDVAAAAGAETGSETEKTVLKDLK
jgi:hypothetical protein